MIYSDEIHIHIESFSFSMYFFEFTQLNRIKFEISSMLDIAAQRRRLIFIHALLPNGSGALYNNMIYEGGTCLSSRPDTCRDGNVKAYLNAPWPDELIYGVGICRDAPVQVKSGRSGRIHFSSPTWSRSGWLELPRESFITS